MKVAIKTPRKDWEWKNIDPSLKNLQDLVGGYIELVPNIFTDAIIYCDEEGKLKDLEPNFVIYSFDLCDDPIDIDDDPIEKIVGPVIMFGPFDKNGNETELTEELFNKTIKCMEFF